jgi:hypothetical protein
MENFAFQESGAKKNLGCNASEAGAAHRHTKAPEGWRSPRRFALSGVAEIRASVLDCGGPPPLFPFLFCPLLASYGGSNQTTKQMKTQTKSIALTALTLALAGSAWSADKTVAGKWKGQFDSQIGLQKYTYEFKVDGTNLTGKAIGEREMGTNEVAIAEGKINKDEISFVEPLKFQDNELRIEYTGKIAGDEIKFHRKVGDFAEEDFVAKRVKEAEPKAEVKPKTKAGTNSPPARP